MEKQIGVIAMRLSKSGSMLLFSVFFFVVAYYVAGFAGDTNMPHYTARQMIAGFSSGAFLFAGMGCGILFFIKLMDLL